MTVEIPRDTLERTLEFASLYGPTIAESSKHTLINMVRIHVFNGYLEFCGQTQPVKSNIVYGKFMDDDIRCDDPPEVIEIGSIAKIIGGKQKSGRGVGVSWKEMISEFDDIVTIEKVNNQLVFDRGKSFTGSISTVETEIMDDWSVDLKMFHEKTAIDPPLLERKGKKIKDYLSFEGRYMELILDDQKRMESSTFNFQIDPSLNNQLVMKLGTKSRSSKRVIPLDEINTDGPPIDRRVFNGIEGFTNAIDPDKPVYIYWIRYMSAFVFLQKTDSHILKVVAGEYSG